LFVGKHCRLLALWYSILFVVSLYIVLCVLGRSTWRDEEQIQVTSCRTSS